MKVVVLAGGVGGAKLVDGLARIIGGDELTAIVNTGDDFEHLGLRICPDLDTVMYTLAGIANGGTGWGIEGDTFRCLDQLAALGAPAWFRLGDRDLATSVYRTLGLKGGARLTRVTAELCAALGVRQRVLPMTDGSVATKVMTDEGELDFQDYFVRRRCEPRVQSFRFAGIEGAAVPLEVRAALDSAEVVIFGPSNPFVSIGPILAIAGMRELISRKPAIAVTPIVGGQALKGPAAKMLAEMGLDVSATSVARRYAGVIGGFVVDEVDGQEEPAVRELGFEVLVAQTVMRSDSDREQLARETLEFAAGVRPVGQ